MISKLTEYYDQVGILSTNFHCPYYEECLVGSRYLIKGKAAYIGAEYEKHTLPRILFVSLGPDCDQDFNAPQKRTPQGVRIVEENRRWQQFKPLLHWYTTHKLAVLIAQVFNPSLTYEDAHHIFAHTNSAKCCADKKNKDVSPAVLFKNCKIFLNQEINLLDPEIIIGQGGNAQKAIEISFPEITRIQAFQQIPGVHKRIQAISINVHPVLYIKMIYPSWRNDRTRKQEEEFLPYLSAVKAYAEQVKLL